MNKLKNLFFFLYLLINVVFVYAQGIVPSPTVTPPLTPSPLAGIFKFILKIVLFILPFYVVTVLPALAQQIIGKAGAMVGGATKGLGGRFSAPVEIWRKAESDKFAKNWAARFGSGFKDTPVIGGVLKLLSLPQVATTAGVNALGRVHKKAAEGVADRVSRVSQALRNKWQRRDEIEALLKNGDINGAATLAFGKKPTDKKGAREWEAKKNQLADNYQAQLAQISGIGADGRTAAEAEADKKALEGEDANYESHVQARQLALMKARAVEIKNSNPDIPNLPASNNLADWSSYIKTHGGQNAQGDLISIRRQAESDVRGYRVLAKHARRLGILNNRPSAEQAFVNELINAKNDGERAEKIKKQQEAINQAVKNRLATSACVQYASRSALNQSLADAQRNKEAQERYEDATNKDALDSAGNPTAEFQRWLAEEELIKVIKLRYNIKDDNEAQKTLESFSLANIGDIVDKIGDLQRELIAKNMAQSLPIKPRAIPLVTGVGAGLGKIRDGVMDSGIARAAKSIAGGLRDSWEEADARYSYVALLQEGVVPGGRLQPVQDWEDLALKAFDPIPTSRRADIYQRAGRGEEGYLVLGAKEFALSDGSLFAEGIQKGDLGVLRWLDYMAYQGHRLPHLKRVARAWRAGAAQVNGENSSKVITMDRLLKMIDVYDEMFKEAGGIEAFDRLSPEQQRRRAYHKLKRTRIPHFGKLDDLDAFGVRGDQVDNLLDWSSQVLEAGLPTIKAFDYGAYGLMSLQRMFETMHAGDIQAGRRDFARTAFRQNPHMFIHPGSQYALNMVVRGLGGRVEFDDKSGFVRMQQTRHLSTPDAAILQRIWEASHASLSHPELLYGSGGNGHGGQHAVSGIGASDVGLSGGGGLNYPGGGGGSGFSGLSDTDSLLNKIRPNLIGTPAGEDLVKALHGVQGALHELSVAMAAGSPVSPTTMTNVQTAFNQLLTAGRRGGANYELLGQEMGIDLDSGRAGLDYLLQLPSLTPETQAIGAGILSKIGVGARGYDIDLNTNSFSSNPLAGTNFKAIVAQAVSSQSSIYGLSFPDARDLNASYSLGLTPANIASIVDTSLPQYQILPDTPLNLAQYTASSAVVFNPLITNEISAITYGNQVAEELISMGPSGWQNISQVVAPSNHAVFASRAAWNKLRAAGISDPTVINQMLGNVGL